MNGRTRPVFTWDAIRVETFEPARVVNLGAGVEVRFTLGAAGVAMFEAAQASMAARRFPDKTLPFFESTQFGVYLPAGFRDA